MNNDLYSDWETLLPEINKERRISILYGENKSLWMRNHYWHPGYGLVSIKDSGYIESINENDYVSRIPHIYNTKCDYNNVLNEYFSTSLNTEKRFIRSFLLNHILHNYDSSYYNGRFDESIPLFLLTMYETDPTNMLRNITPILQQYWYIMTRLGITIDKQKKILSEGLVKIKEHSKRLKRLYNIIKGSIGNDDYDTFGKKYYSTLKKSVAEESSLLEFTEVIIDCLYDDIISKDCTFYSEEISGLMEFSFEYPEIIDNTHLYLSRSEKIVDISDGKVDMGYQVVTIPPYFYQDNSYLVLDTNDNFKEGDEIVKIELKNGYISTICSAPPRLATKEDLLNNTYRRVINKV